MTREEAILLSAYTQYLLVPDFSEVHKFCEATLGRPILTHEFASKSIWKELRDALRPQIESLIHNISALRSPTREQVEKVWRGEWAKVGSYAECKKCGHMPTNGKTHFCSRCGSAMTDEAVDMVIERLEALKDGSTAD